MELSLSFLRENPNKLSFIELPQNFCDWLPEPEKIYSEGKPKALPYLPKNNACFKFYQHKFGNVAFQPTQSNQNRSLK